MFTAFVGSITDVGLELLTNVLETKESLDGQQELFDKDDEDEDEDSDGVMDDGADGIEEVNVSAGDEGEDSDELDSDVEIISASSASTSSQPDEDAADADSDEAAKLEAALTCALTPHAPKNDSDSDMSDGAMLTLDETLSNIFRQRTKPPSASKKRSEKAAKQNITNFKVRVLDLLEIFAKADKKQKGEVRHDPGVLLLPLLACVRKTGDRAVAERCFGVLKICLRNPLPFHFSSSSSPGREEEERLWALLKEVHELAELDPGSAGRDRYAKACSTASLVLGKMLIGGGSEEVQEEEFEKRVRRIVGAYAETLTKWVVEGGGVGVQRSFFVEFVDWVAGVRGEKSKGEVIGKGKGKGKGKRKRKKGV